MGKHLFAASRHIMNALGIVSADDPVDTVSGPTPGSDLDFAVLAQLVDMMGIGQHGTGHADHVQITFANRIVGSCRIGDTGCVKDRDIDLVAHCLGKLQIPADGTHMVGQMRASSLSSEAWDPTTLIKSIRPLDA